MGLWRIRTAVEDRPGRLADLAGAVAAEGGDIVGLTIHTDAAGVVDEFIVDVPGDHRRLLEELTRRGAGEEAAAVPARPREVGDDVTRALMLTARLRGAPHRLPEALAELLNADEARWTGLGTSGRAAAPQFPEEPESELLVPVGALRGVRLRRVDRPFTWTESARADALVRSVLPPAGPVPTGGTLTTASGERLHTRPVCSGDARALRRLHRRCTPHTKRRRYLTAVEEPGSGVLGVFCDPERGLTLAAWPEGADEPVALAHLMYTLDPGVGEMAFLVEDSWQGRGVGTALAGALAAVAVDWGMAEVRAETAADNRAMLGIMRGLGAAVGRPSTGTVQARLPLAGRVPAREPGPLASLMTRPGAAGR
ncbi:GNAT family N-acetyltransferase [Nocardiopsis halophila]|uniref:GNAT family N-acetyltransferase n=1 Tax=Nocardiopsis halophila TaxID=141692 RepID=UPI000344A765|nr:GNAT family N-acetyltransferase [Nocardiopsis halophila]